MADSTAYIDTTGFIDFDATSYVYVSDSTSTITPAEAAQAQAIVNDFNAVSGPMEKKSKAIENQFNDIINDISKIDPTDYTPASVMDALTQNGLDQAYSTVSWQQGVDALKQVNVIGANCSLIDSSSLPKYGDLARQIGSMRKGVLENVSSSITNVVSDIASKTGRSLAESAIGQRMSRIVNSGRSKMDKVSSSNDSPVSSILETGKAGMAKAQSLISKMGPLLNQMDKMINCANSTGGVDFVDKVDDMIDKTNNIFGKAYLFDDPADPRYGEFNQGAFANAIPAVPKLALDNVFKATNMFNKAENNANLSTDRLIKQAKEGAKSTSSLDPNGENQSNNDKRTLAEKLSKVKVSFPKVPAAPGRPAQSKTTVEAPEPQTVVTPEQTDPQPQPAEEIAFTNLVFNKEFEDFDGSYATLDPNGVGIPAILSSAYDIIPDGGTNNPDAKMNIKVRVSGMAILNKSKNGQLYYAVKYSTLTVTFERIDIPYDPAPIGATLSDIFTRGRLVDPDDQKPLTDDEKRDLATKLVSGSLKKMKQLKPALLSTQTFEERFNL
jgi:hypothetical protein